MIRLPVADPGIPDTRSPTRLLLGSHGSRSAPSSQACSSAIAWMVAQALMPFAIGRAIQDGIVDHDNRALAFWTLVLLGLGATQAVAGVMRHRCAVSNWLQASFRLAQVVAHHAARAGPAIRNSALHGRGRRHGLERRDARRRRLRHHRPAGRRDRRRTSSLRSSCCRRPSSLGLVVLVGVPVLVLLLGTSSSRSRRGSSSSARRSAS